MNIEKNYGIELLRLVLIYMVCVLHTLGQGGILSASIVGTTGYKVYWFLEIFSYCAVDGFALISGYTASNKPRKYEKIVSMWFQVVFYSFIVTLLFTVIGINDHIGIKEVIKCMMPVTFEKYWYFTAYFALFFISPILNSFIFTVDKITSHKALVLCVFLFSFLGILGDPFKSQSGYSAIWLIVLYCIGAFAKQIRLFESKKTSSLITLWALCVSFTWLLKVFFSC